MAPLPLPGIASLPQHLLKPQRCQPVSPFPVLDVLLGKSRDDGSRPLAKCTAALGMSNFARLFGLMASRSEREKLARDVLNSIATEEQPVLAFSDPVAVNSLVMVCKVVAESVNALSTAGKFSITILLQRCNVK